VEDVPVVEEASAEEVVEEEVVEEETTDEAEEETEEAEEERGPKTYDINYRRMSKKERRKMKRAKGTK
jgi:hypothetical protein